ncbi:MAG: hypothetical protein NZO58_06875 [Gemmataceae bacterium]|nr:hypothetical protein [Gemmataceae bacterium]
MSPHRISVAVLLALLAISTPTLAQPDKADDKANDKDAEAVRRRLARAEEEYRNYFKRPETPFEFWAAIKHEFAVGKFDLAALHLDQLLKKLPAEEVDKALAAIENAEGMSTFLKLTLVKDKDWSDNAALQKEARDNVAALIQRVTAAVESSLSDPQRFAKFIPRLAAPSPEERNFAFAQIDRAKDRAAPYLIEALRTNVGKPLHRAVTDAMVQFDADMVPAWLEVFKAASPEDAKDTDLRATLLDIILRRHDTRAVPYLWHMAASKTYPPFINAAARHALARLTNTEIDKLPPAHIALTELAEAHYQHKVKFPAGKPIRVYPWDGVRLAAKPVELNVRQAEEFFGKRYAREALELKPDYRPAQMVFLNLTLERAYSAQLDQAILKRMPPAVQQLIGIIDGDLLLRVLDRALDENNLPVILAATQALGERGEFSAARPAIGGAPRGITRALYYPDRRVQFAAVIALLRMPAPETPIASARVVDILRRFVAGAAAPKALVVFVPPDQAAAVRQAFKPTGLEPVLVDSLKQGYEHPFGLADVDVVFLHGSEFRAIPYAISQLRGDADLGNVPIFLLDPKDNDPALARLATKYRNVKVLPEGLLKMGEELKTEIDEAIRAAAGAPLSTAERKALLIGSLDLLWRMARNELPGYDVRPAVDAVVTALRSPDAAPLALEILGRLPGTIPQTRLAAVVLDNNADKLRLAAAFELNRNFQKYGVALDRDLMSRLKKAYQEASDPQLKAELAITMGAFGPTTQLTGTRLLHFRPELPAPPPPKKEDN